MSPVGGSSSNATVRNAADAGRRGVRRLSSKVPCRSRSWRSRSRSTSATVRRGAVGEPLALGQQLAALVDHRLAVPATGRWSTRPGRRRRRRTPRGSARSRCGPAAGGPRRGPTVIGLPERLASTVAPASAASALGGTGTHMSSQTSTCSDQAGHVGGGEEQVGPERHLAGRRARSSRRAGRRRARTSGARRTRGRSAGRTSARRPSTRPAVDDDRAVEHPGAVDQRRAHDERPAAGRRSPRRARRSPSSTASSSVSWRNRSSMA